MILQQSLRDLDTAYRNFFDGLKGKRPKTGPPRFNSRKDSRQVVRFTANAGWKITPGGKLRLPKVGDIAVKWSRNLPSVPTTVTVIKDAAGRYFASPVAGTDPSEVLPATTPETNIDLGLSHFAILSDGTKIDSPRFLRRAEERLRKAQQALSGKVKGSNNREKARLKVARAHAKVADARREFHHQLSTKIIRDDQAIAVEDLAVKGASPHSPGQVRPRRRIAGVRQDAEYKAARYGRTLIKIVRFEPTSQVCSQRDVRDGLKPFHLRQWTCGDCRPSLTGTSTRRSTSPKPPDWRYQPAERG
ncbi:RNA-guided endonuclease InsQ/TnpB family protein [Streptomyces chartreusis]|uniref:RNA-guided endonuclease InsQ/TnpB family protein n=1 Tax=Streptomyces chartreusis TaxID=1969 RepID=UPI0038647A39|nr:transposase [Streptomyces chartreusis]WTA33464.1 transposase [Streptomyces chartreusis]